MARGKEPAFRRVAPSFTPARGPVVSVLRRRPCTPRGARTWGRRSTHGHPARDSAPPIDSTDRPRPSPPSRTSEEVLERELLLRSPRPLFWRCLTVEVVAEKGLLSGRLRAREQGLLVPTVHLRHVGERLRDPSRVVLPVRLRFELPAGQVRLHLHRGLRVVRDDPRDLHPRHELLAHFPELPRRNHVAHRARVHVILLFLDG